MPLIENNGRSANRRFDENDEMRPMGEARGKRNFCLRRAGERRVGTERRAPGQSNSKRK
ncbi:unnamed protein product [Nesidiocoris tenuis]|uniref:Uncharacterized protein n=1 Tax=Nesidiocoris tenuis TaxID=355587 RepID=A0A6H5GDV4_9HEMI|nr:unnamed protein product [Nesidiocoris tenuis]